MAGTLSLRAADSSDDGAGDALDALTLELIVRDPEVVAALAEYPRGRARDEFALSALRIGVLAMAQARGRIDGDAIRQETERMLSGMQSELEQHAKQLNEKLSGALKDYFDPQSGRFEERIRRLVQKDGELETLLRRQVGTSDSELTKTLTAHFGDGSPLLKLLAPDASAGLMAALRETLCEQLTHQRNHVLSEFSLDREGSALNRLVAELSKNQGQLQSALQGKIDTVVGEFSLDKEDSALSRLVGNVDRAQRVITAEFSLDNDGSALSRLKQMLASTQQSIRDHLTLDSDDSALSRLKRELLTLMNQHAQTNLRFQEEVKVSLAQMVARKEEAARSTRHGLTFQAALAPALTHECGRQGDLVEVVGETTGLVRFCKKGDFVVELGPDSAVPSARIVVEAKEDFSYSLPKARDEIAEARANRGAQVGLFVFSRATLPVGVEPVTRIGSDVFVAWDAEDASSDLLLRVGLTLSKALCVQQGRHRAAQTADFEALEKAVLEVERQAGLLEEICASTKAIEQHSGKIAKRVETTRKSLEKQVETLRERLGDLKQQSG